MKKLIFFLTLSFLLLFLIDSASANIITDAEKFNLIDESSIEKEKIENYQLKYSFSNGESILINSIQDRANLDLEEVFCWSECNIYPNFKLTSEELIVGGEVLSVQEFNLDNGFNKNVNRIIGVFQDEKINLEANKEAKKYDSDLKTPEEFIVNWNGKIILDENKTINLILNISGISKLIFDDAVIIDTINDPNGNNFINDYLIQSGNHTINITYYSNKEFGKVNLLWSENNSEYFPISNVNLFFESGDIKFFNENLNLRSFRTASIPESYIIDYSVYPSGVLYLPNSVENTHPLILVHGLHGKYPYWYNIPNQLTDFGNDVYQMYYSDANVSNFMTSGLFKYGVNRALEDYPPGTKSDVVAHSMGNLVVLGYINGLGKESDGSKVVYENNIQSLVMIAGPVHGSYLANRVMKDESAGLICGWFIDPDDPEAQAYYDIAIGSEFTWYISKNNLNNNIRYLSIAGIDDDLVCLPFEADNSDSFVSLASASLIDKNVPLAVLRANHDNLRGHCWTNLGNRCRWNLFDGFYYDDTMSDLVDGFLDGESNSVLESKLYDNEYFISNQAEADSSSFQEGMSLMKLTSKNTISSIKIKNSAQEFIFTKNPQTEIYYHYNYGEGPFLSCIGGKFGKLNLTLTDMICIGKIGLAIYTGTFDESLLTCLNSNLAKFGITLVTQDVQQCLSKPIDYGLTIPVGTYDLYANNVDTDENIEIKPAQTTLYELNICLPDIKNTTWSNWADISCLSDNKMNQSRFLIQYDANSCDKIQNKTIYKYRATEFCGLLLIDPIEGIYNDRSLAFNVSYISKLAKLTYSDNNGRETTLCSNCYGYARRKTLGDGNHTLSFGGLTLDGKSVTNQVNLFIDSTDPRISTTKPSSRKYTNGSDFYIKFKEENPINLSITYNPTINLDLGVCEEYRGYKECYYDLNLSSYDNQEIEYYFTVEDIAGNKDESRPTKIKVDTTAPEIKDFTAPIVKRYVYFNMTVLNEDRYSFNKVEYIDSYDGTRARWKSLCTSLKNNNCYKKLSFRTGAHDITVRATDDAGNSDTEILSFTIV